MTERRTESLIATLWFSAQFGALLVMGPIFATLVAGVGAAAHSAKDPIGPRALSIGSAVVASFTSGLLFNLLVGMPHTFESVWQAAVVMATVAVYCAINAGVIAVSRWFTTRSVDAAWKEALLRDARNCLLSASVVVLIIQAISHHQWGLLGFVLLPLYCVYRAIQNAVRREQVSEHRETLIESLDEGACVVDMNGRVTMWNAALERMLNCPREQAIGRTLAGAVPMLADTSVANAVGVAIAGGSDSGVLRLMLPAAAGAAVLQVRVVPNRRQVMLIWHDVTDRARTDSALQQSEARFALLESSISDGLWEWDLETQVIRFSAQWRNIVGLPSTSATGSPDEWFGRVHPEDRDLLKTAIDAYLAGHNDEFVHQHRIRHEDGTYRHVLCRGIVVHAVRRRPVRLGGSIMDVTERTEAERSLRDSGSRDPLTGLCNRAVFVEVLRHRLNALKKRQAGQFAVLFLDLDRFKVVNDSLGHLAGDELLTSVSRRLESCLREGDVLGRLGGDEFAIFLHDVREEKQANAIAFRIQDAFSTAFLIGGREVFTSTSIGIAFSNFRYDAPEEIMRDADTAMYHAKARGKARHEVFDARMHAQAIDRIGLESDLQRAVRCNDLEVHYQPIVSLNSGACVGFEALLRWTRDGKAVSPATFIPVAEELGLIETIGDRVLREACRTFAGWQRRFPNSGFDCITVNVSTRQLVQQGFLRVVEEAVKDALLMPNHLRLEITETALLTSPQSTAVLLQKLRELGVKIYLDDFGTGHSSLSHLHQLPVDALKIDRSFVESLLLPDRPAIIESILALAYTLETGVVAEGVEDEVQALALERLGCRFAQGYLFSPAIPPAKVDELLESGQSLVASRRLMVDRSPNAHLPWVGHAAQPAAVESELISIRG
jgi:diguanylate cyclase (GGDEF)-like protein/PAS domain S-box-containing protein